MRKLLVISLGLCLLSMPGSAVAPSSLNEESFELPRISVTEFLKLSLRDIEKWAGRKLSLGERISLKVIKIRMKKAARKDPGLSVREFMLLQQRKNAGSAILYILLGALLIFFFLFLMMFTDS